MRALTATSRSAAGRTSSSALLASAGVKMRGGTAPYRRDATPRLAAWLVLVGLLIAVAYASPKPPPDALYKWSTGVGALIQDAILLLLVMVIAGFDRQLVAWRAPRSWPSALKLLAALLVATYVLEIAYNALVHPGNEQRLVPNHWEPSHAAVYIVNGLVICLWVPFVEETIYRGLGYSLLAPFGQVPAILTVGILFGLSHGLILDLPVIATFGCALAYVRAKTDSAVPGMLLHGTFNLIALVLAVL
jgi:membrane protease YdiL (CAAX protease family)